jgi:hypothetical protein
MPIDSMKCVSRLEQPETSHLVDRDHQMMKHLRNWLLVTMSAVTLGACGADLPPAVDTPLVAPAPEKALVGAYKAVEEEKLTGFIEVSAVSEAPSLGPGQYMLCLRGSPSPSEPQHTYAVFFNNDEYRGVRLSIILDACERQAFSPLPPKPAPKDEPGSKSEHEGRTASISSR